MRDHKGKRFMRVKLIPMLAAFVACRAVCADTPPKAGAPSLPEVKASTSPLQAPPGRSRELPPATRTDERSNAGVAPAPSSVEPPITLDALEKLALSNNPTIRAAEALVQQQVGLLIQATRYPNPTAGWVQSTPSRSGESATQGAFISQDFVTAGKIRLARHAESLEVQWRNWQLQAQVGRVINDVRIRYYEVLGAQQAALAAQELERLAEEDLKAVKQLLEAKQASRPDVLHAEIHLSSVSSALQDAKLRHQAAWRQLANLIGVAQLPPTVLTENLEEHIPQLDWQESLQRVFADSPVLRGQAAQVQAATYEVELMRRQAIPNISTQIVVQRDTVKNFNEVSTLVSVPVPLFNRNRGNIVNAQATLQQQEQEYRRIQLALSDQLATSFQQYQSARNQVDHLREVLPRTVENYDLTSRAFKEGQAGFSFMRVLDAQQTYFQTKLSYLDALTSLHKIAIEIEGLELTGGLNPTEAGTALQATARPESGVRNVLLQQAQQQNAGIIRNLPGALQSTISEP